MEEREWKIKKPDFREVEGCTIEFEWKCSCGENHINQEQINYESSMWFFDSILIRWRIIKKPATREQLVDALMKISEIYSDMTGTNIQERYIELSDAFSSQISEIDKLLEGEG